MKRFHTQELTCRSHAFGEADGPAAAFPPRSARRRRRPGRFHGRCRAVAADDKRLSQRLGASSAPGLGWALTDVVPNLATLQIRPEHFFFFLNHGEKYIM